MTGRQSRQAGPGADPSPLRFHYQSFGLTKSPRRQESPCPLKSNSRTNADDAVADSCSCSSSRTARVRAVRVDENKVTHRMEKAAQLCTREPGFLAKPSGMAKQYHSAGRLARRPVEGHGIQAQPYHTEDTEDGRGKEGERSHERGMALDHKLGASRPHAPLPRSPNHTIQCCYGITRGRKAAADRVQRHQNWSGRAAAEAEWDSPHRPVSRVWQSSMPELHRARSLRHLHSRTTILTDSGCHS